MTTQPTPPAGVMDESAQAPAPAPDQAQTVEVPLTAIAAAKEGDTVQFKVISRDEQGGTANLAPVAPEAPEGGGSDDMAAEFGKDKMQKGMM